MMNFDDMFKNNPRQGAIWGQAYKVFGPGPLQKMMESMWDQIPGDDNQTINTFTELLGSSLPQGQQPLQGQQPPPSPPPQEQMPVPEQEEEVQALAPELSDRELLLQKLKEAEQPRMSGWESFGAGLAGIGAAIQNSAGRNVDVAAATQAAMGPYLQRQKEYKSDQDLLKKTLLEKNEDKDQELFINQTTGELRYFTRGSIIPKDFISEEQWKILNNPSKSKKTEYYNSQTGESIYLGPNEDIPPGFMSMDRWKIESTDRHHRERLAQGDRHHVDKLNDRSEEPDHLKKQIEDLMYRGYPKELATEIVYGPRGTQTEAPTSTSSVPTTGSTMEAPTSTSSVPTTGSTDQGGGGGWREPTNDDLFGEGPSNSGTPPQGYVYMFGPGKMLYLVPLEKEKEAISKGYIRRR